MQEDGYGCGLYSVSNALNLKNFVTLERLEISKKGNTNGQLSKWLQEDGLDISIDSFYYDHVGESLPDTHLYYYPEQEGVYLPLLINVKLSEEGKRHLVACLINKNGDMFLMDSLKKEVVKAKLCDINNMYHSVFGLFVFMYNSDGNYVTLSKP
jgi:hypothetical protein